MEGTVVKWLTSYGFIKTDEVEDDVFVHESEVRSQGRLSEGQRVSFELENAPRGPKAVNVEVIE